MLNVKKYIIICIFIIPICFFGYLSMALQSETFIEEESRMTYPMPIINFENYFSGLFTEAFENFFNDAFLFREQLINVSDLFSNFYFFTGLKSQSEVLDKNGILFFDGRITEKFIYDESSMLSYAEALNKLYKECGEIQTIVMLPPSSEELYLPDRYRNLKNSQRFAIQQLERHLNGPVVLPLNDIFEKNKSEYLYFNTDHHWTMLGAYYAYKALANTLGLPCSDIHQWTSGTYENYKGSLYKYQLRLSNAIETQIDEVRYFIPPVSGKTISYRQADLSDPSERQLVYTDYDEDTNFYNVFLGGDMPIGYIHSSNRNGRSIMVVRDSYGHAFLPFLTQAFEHIYAVEPRYFHGNSNTFNLSDFTKGKSIDTMLFLNYPYVALSNYSTVWGEVLQSISANAASNQTYISPSTDRVYLNGRGIFAKVYKKDGVNRIRLADIAYALNGTNSAFNFYKEVNSLYIEKDRPYKAGRPEQKSESGARLATEVEYEIKVDTKTQGKITAYVIKDELYVNMRDVAELLNLGLGWDDGAKAILISTR